MLIQSKSERKVRSIFTRDMYFFLMVILALIGFLLPPYRDYFLISAIFSALGVLWVEYREHRVRKKARRFRQEIMLVKSFEAVKDYDKARNEYKRLLGKYLDIVDFADFLKECIKQIDGKRGVLPKPEETMQKQEEAEARVRRQKEKADAVSNADRRRFKRAVFVGAHVPAISGLDDPTAKAEGKIKNLSAGGSLMEARLPVGNGDMVLLNGLSLPDGTTFEEIFAKVVHVTNADGAQVLGLEFIYLEDDEIKKIDDCIQQVLVQSPA